MPDDIRPLTPALLGDWLAFFDGDAFADNRDWSTCWCRCYLFGARGFDAWDAACASGENRAAMVERVGAGEVDGLLAYRGGRVAGWVQFGPTTRFVTPGGPLDAADPGVASIVCFVVSPAHRRTGVARALLRAACAELARRGFTAVDARPATAPEDGAMHLFPGPLRMYLADGFEPAGPAGARQRVRCLLGPH